ncbi:MAG: alpha/beta hydrolase, partial [Stackebrandtia sp.]
MDDPREILARAAEPGVAVSYGPDAEHVVEYFAPVGAARGTVAMLHGGFWQHDYDRVHVRPLCRALAAQGYATASLEYRRVGGGGGWPHTFDDVRAALRALPRLLRDLDAPAGPL